MIRAENIPPLQAVRSMPGIMHIGSVAFQGCLKTEYFEWLNDDFESSASNEGFRPFPWGSYTYGQPLFMDRRTTAISTAKNSFKDNKVYPRL